MDYGLFYYLITILDSLSGLFIFTVIMSIIAFIVFLFSLGMYSDGCICGESFEKITKYVKPTLITFILSLLMLVFIPTKKEMLTITGLSIGQKGATNVISELKTIYPLLKDKLIDELNLNKKEEK